MSAIPVPWNWLIVCSDYQPGDGGLAVYLLPVLGSQHLTAFDGDNTAAQQPTNAISQDILISGLRDVT